MGRAPCCEKVGLRRGRWTAEEDEKLINYIKQNGEGSWRSLPKKAGLLRCGKSCRLRWINYLRTGLKRGNFTREEEETIIKLHISLGNKWSLIASNLPGRTDNEVKNYWNSHLSRKIYSFRSNNNGSIVTTSDMIKMASKKRGGRVSRAVAKKYNMHTISKTTSTTPTISSPKIGAINGIQKHTTVPNPEAKMEGVGLIETRSGVPQLTAAENEAEAGNNVVGSREESGKNHFKQMDIYYNEYENGNINSMHDIRCDGLASCPGILMASPDKLGGENEVLGPNEGIDDVTLLLERVLENEVMDLSEISVDSSQTENEYMDPESALINKDSDSGLYECFSPIDSYFSHELNSWDTDYAALGFGLWDEGDDIIWPWETRTGETELLH